MNLTVNKVSYLLLYHALYINNTNIEKAYNMQYFFCQKKKCTFRNAKLHSVYL